MELVRNIFPQSLTRYITYGEDLLAYLQEMYGYDIDFCIAHENDRWFFDCPDQLDDSQLRHARLQPTRQ
ncbi:hypothetical protein B0T11DRAFT_331058 [Plectosphaerella cucumerina]|uniref:Uncharacterized protein n=1 Tax=Plectosphaerella cucumerina TaxID=40658 RepID=A0A8K0TJ60_9PEZI|nr:hypothetical protein B0T11DRAFT_331058 [Plectosphaerella cucumerina]